MMTLEALRRDAQLFRDVRDPNADFVGEALELAEFLSDQLERLKTENRNAALRMMGAAVEFGLVDTDGDDSPKPKEYGGLTGLADLLIARLRNLEQDREARAIDRRRAECEVEP
jgi:hypothetical protein